MLVTSSLVDASQQLNQLFLERLFNNKVQAEKNQIIHAPVGLFLVREDGANGSKLAKEIVQSFAYWHATTAHYFDALFLGWGYADKPVYENDAYVNCVKELEALLNWHDGGGSHLIVTNYVYDLNTHSGFFDFSQAIPLNITQVLKNNQWQQLSELMIQGLLTPIKQNSAGDTWEISDYLALLNLRRIFWQALVKKLGHLLGLVDVQQYALRNLRK